MWVRCWRWSVRRGEKGGKEIVGRGWEVNDFVVGFSVVYECYCYEM